MNTSVTTPKTKKTTGVIFPLLTLMLANGLIALIYYFFVHRYNYSFIVNGEPTFSLSANLLFWITFGMIIALGVVPYMLFNMSNFKTNRCGLRLNYSIYYMHFLLFLLWAFFTFTLKLPTAGLVMLGLAICLGIFVVYRFMTNTIVAGSFLTVWCLWLIYVFVLNLAFVLLR